MSQYTILHTELARLEQKIARLEQQASRDYLVAKKLKTENKRLRLLQAKSNTDNVTKARAAEGDTLAAENRRLKVLIGEFECENKTLKALVANYQRQLLSLIPK